MQAIVLEQKGGPEVLRMKTVPDPLPGPEEVLVALRSTAVNRADLLQRMGLYPGPPMPHEIPGLEFAGTVAEVGARVSEHAVGDPVMGIANGGCYAEQIAVHERQAMRVPPALDLADAGAFPEVFITAWDALVRQGGLTSGRWALVHAGIIQVGVLAQGAVPFDVGILMRKRATLTGTTLRARPIEQKIAITREFAAQMLPHVAAGRLAPVIDSRYPLAEVASAHARMAANANAGKLVLDVA